MGKLKFEKLNKEEIVSWIENKELFQLYDNLRFGSEGIIGYILKWDKKNNCYRDYKIREKYDSEIYRRGIRVELEKLMKKYNRFTKLQLLTKEGIDLGRRIDYLIKPYLFKFLRFDIELGNLVKCNELGIICFYQYNTKGIDQNKLKWVDNKFLYRERYFDFDLRVDGERDVYLSQFYHKGLVESEEFKGWVPSKKWYENMISENRLLISVEGDFNYKVYHNLYPLIEIEKYEELKNKDNWSGIWKFVGVRK
jgi:hypothetical protein